MRSRFQRRRYNLRRYHWADFSDVSNRCWLRRRDTHESQFATILRLVFPLALPGIDEGNITEKEMNRRIEGLDRERAKYYNYFSSQKWGARGNNDPMISNIGKGYQAGICRAGAVFEGAALLMENGRKQEDWSPPWRISACLRC